VCVVLRAAACLITALLLVEGIYHLVVKVRGRLLGLLEPCGGGGGGGVVVCVVLLVVLLFC
jgi:hypothetical protein